MYQSHRKVFKTLTNKVMLDVNVLGTLVVNWIESKINRSFVVHMNWQRNWLLESEFREEGSKPDGMVRGIRDGHVFCFC